MPLYTRYLYWKPNEQKIKVINKCARKYRSPLKPMANTTSAKKVDEFLLNVKREDWLQELSGSEKLQLNMMKSWFMAPFSDNSQRARIFKTGHDNEGKLAKTVFLTFQSEKNQFEHPIEVVNLKQCGLLSIRDTSIGASLDGIGVLNQLGGLFMFALEFKTRVYMKTVSADEVRDKYGTFVEINLSLDDLASIKGLENVIPCKAHRIQLLHHIIVIDARKGLLVYGENGGKIIRAVLVTVTSDFVQAYVNNMKSLIKNNIPWLSKDMKSTEFTDFIDFIEPHLGTKGLKQIPNTDVLKECFKICDCLAQHPVDVAFAYAFKFSSVLFYNLTMGGEDAL
eukprot:Pgem_evm1s19203